MGDYHRRSSYRRSPSHDRRDQRHDDYERADRYSRTDRHDRDTRCKRDEIYDRDGRKPNHAQDTSINRKLAKLSGINAAELDPVSSSRKRRRSFSGDRSWEFENSNLVPLSNGSRTESGWLPGDRLPWDNGSAASRKKRRRGGARRPRRPKAQKFDQPDDDRDKDKDRTRDGRRRQSPDALDSRSPLPAEPQRKRRRRKGGRQDLKSPADDSRDIEETSTKPVKGKGRRGGIRVGRKKREFPPSDATSPLDEEGVANKLEKRRLRRQKMAIRRKERRRVEKAYVDGALMTEYEYRVLTGSPHPRADADAEAGPSPEPSMRSVVTVPDGSSGAPGGTGDEPRHSFEEWEMIKQKSLPEGKSKTQRRRVARSRAKARAHATAAAPDQEKAAEAAPGPAVNTDQTAASPDVKPTKASDTRRLARESRWQKRRELAAKRRAEQQAKKAAAASSEDASIKEQPNETENNDTQHPPKQSVVPDASAKLSEDGNTLSNRAMRKKKRLQERILKTKEKRALRQKSKEGTVGNDGEAGSSVAAADVDMGDEQSELLKDAELTGSDDWYVLEDALSGDENLIIDTSGDSADEENLCFNALGSEEGGISETSTHQRVQVSTETKLAGVSSTGPHSTDNKAAGDMDTSVEANGLTVVRDDEGKNEGSSKSLNTEREEVGFENASDTQIQSERIDELTNTVASQGCTQKTDMASSDPQCINTSLTSNMAREDKDPFGLQPKNSEASSVVTGPSVFTENPVSSVSVVPASNSDDSVVSSVTVPSDKPDQVPSQPLSSACTTLSDDSLAIEVSAESDKACSRPEHSDNPTTGSFTDSSDNKSTTESTSANTPSPRQPRFEYGNYNRYYGYRNPTLEDPRLQALKPAWFRGKDVLDVGCNIGHVTLSVARDFAPRKCVGLDIDASLVKIARKNVKHYIKDYKDEDAAVATLDQEGNFHQAEGSTTLAKLSFPKNVSFVHANFVLESDALLETVRAEYDVVLCLSVTKWVHLNFGDAGLRRFLQRIFKVLRPGGLLLLEAQPWSSYSKRKKMTERIARTYPTLQLMPYQFAGELERIGFLPPEQLLQGADGAGKGFQRELQLYRKPDERAVQPAVTSEAARSVTTTCVETTAQHSTEPQPTSRSPAAPALSAGSASVAASESQPSGHKSGSTGSALSGAERPLVVATENEQSQCTVDSGKSVSVCAKVSTQQTHSDNSEVKSKQASIVADAKEGQVGTVSGVMPDPGGPKVRTFILTPSRP